MEQSKFYQIKNITEQEYTLVGCDGSVITRPIRDIDKSASAFTIQDAKDGDILCTYECDEPKIVFILKGTPKKHYALSYHCYYNIMYPHFGPDSEKGCLAPNDEDIKPATKEQRDTLLKAMADAGYTFDFDKKELKKIEPKSTAWSDEDEMQARQIERIVHNDGCTQKLQKQISDWFKSIKERVQPQPKQEWSEEDRKIIIELIGIFESAVDGGHVSFPYRLIEDYIRVLKSCLHQNTWKPIDDEMKALSEALSLANNCGEEYAFDLRTLYEQLKKLKG